MSGRGINFLFLKTVLRRSLGALLVLYFLFCCTALAVRFIVLPRVSDYQDEICAAASRTLGSEVTVGSVTTSWSAFWPRIEIRDLRITPPGSGVPGLSVPRAAGSVSWRSLLVLEPVFAALTVESPEVRITRLADGTVAAAGVRMPGGGEGGAASALELLLLQHRIDVRDAAVIYRDESVPGSPEAALRGANFTLRESLRGWTAGLQGTLEAEEGKGRAVDARAEIRRTPLMSASRPQTWTAGFYAKTSGVDIGRAAAAAGVSGLRGIADAEVWADLNRGSPAKLTANARVTDLEARLGGDTETFTARAVSGVLRGEANEKAGVFRLTSSGTLITTDAGDTVDTGSLTLEIGLDGDRSRDAFALNGSSLDLEPVCEAAARSGAAPAALRSLLKALSPKGRLTDYSLRVSGIWEKPVWSLSTGFASLSFNGIPDADSEMPGIPGGRNLAGRLDATEKVGRAVLHVKNGAAFFPGIFENPKVALKSLEGEIYWEPLDKLRLSFRGIELENSDVSLAADANWEETDGAGTISVAGRVSRASAENFHKYMPLVAGNDVNHWLRDALAAGEARGAAVVWRGPIEDFPYAGRDPAKELFLVATGLNDAGLDFAPSGKKTAKGVLSRGDVWPVISKINGSLLFRADRMVVIADSCRTAGVSARDVLADIPGIMDGPTVKVRARAGAGLQQMLDYLPKSPLSGWTGHFLDGARATGEAQLILGLTLPVLDLDSSRVSGSVTLKGGDVSLGHGIPVLSKSRGTVFFTESGVWSGPLEASVLGAAAKGALLKENGAVHVRAEGTAGAAETAEAASDILGPAAKAFLANFSGEAAVNLDIRVPEKGETTIAVQSTLEGLKVDLPPPFAKSPDQKLSSSLIWTMEADGGSSVSFRLGDILEAAAALSSDGCLRSLAAGAGAKAAMPERGASIRAMLDELDYEAWLEKIDPVLDALENEKRPGLDLADLQASIRKLVIGNRTFRGVNLAVRKFGASSWNISLDSRNGSGTVRYKAADASGPPELNGKFNELFVPAANKKMVRRYIESTPAEQLPSVSLSIDNLQVEDMEFGAVDIKAVSNRMDGGDHLWDVQKLAFDNGTGRLEASGIWEKSGSTSRTRVSGQMTSANTGQLLGKLGLPSEAVKGAAGEVKFSAEWPGAPQEFRMGELAGDIKVKFGEGKILQIDPGIAGRFLSLISMQSLLKRLTLDFDDVFGKGFDFDRFRFNGRLDKGVMKTENVQIVGSAATILMKGEVDLAAQVMNSDVYVLPHLHLEGPALALAFANPVIGIGSFIASLALKTPLSKVFATEYRVEGPFDSPSVRKIGTVPLDKVGDGGS